MAYSFQNKNSNAAVTVGELNQVVNDISSAPSTTPTLQEVLDNNHDLVDGNNFQGTGAGLGNTGNQVIAIGEYAAKNNTGNYVNAIGNQAAFNNTAEIVNAIGYNSANGNSGNSVNAVGQSAAYSNLGSPVIALGTSAAESNSGNNVIAIGSQAGAGNSLSNVFIIANTELPSYANYAAASLALAGGATGNTYLYHDQATNSIGAVRL